MLSWGTVAQSHSGSNLSEQRLSTLTNLICSPRSYSLCAADRMASLGGYAEAEKTEIFSPLPLDFPTYRAH